MYCCIGCSAFSFGNCIFLHFSISNVIQISILRMQQYHTNYEMSKKNSFLINPNPVKQVSAIFTSVTKWFSIFDPKELGLTEDGGVIQTFWVWNKKTYIWFVDVLRSIIFCFFLHLHKLLGGNWVEVLSMDII